MNLAPKDVSLFTVFADPDAAADAGKSIYLPDTDTGKAIDARMTEMQKWISENFNHDEDPLWPKHGNTFVCDLFEARHLGDDEFVLVWRDIAFTYYKRFGRSCFVSRALTDDETTQFFMELHGALDALSKERSKEDPLAKYKAPAYVPPTDPRLIKEAAEAAAAIAVLDARPGHYTLDERRLMLGKKNNYTPNLQPIANLQRLNDSLEILKDEGIPELRPAGESLT